MRTFILPGILPMLIFMMPAPACFSQPAPYLACYPPDSSRNFLCIEFCGSRYNRSLKRQEFVITAVKLPYELLEKMPRPKGDNPYSSRNRKILIRQREFLKQHGGEKILLNVNKKRFSAFYPKGLRSGAVIESEEYHNWNFLEVKPVRTAPVKRHDPDEEPVYPILNKHIYKILLNNSSLLLAGSGKRGCIKSQFVVFHR